MWLEEMKEISITKCLHSQNSDTVSHVQEKIKKINRGKTQEQDKKKTSHW